MIIWGSKGRIRKVGTGTFHCPACRCLRAYTRLRAARYFTLYFVPLFQTENLGEAVECDVCHGQFSPSVLDTRPPAPLDPQQPGDSPTVRYVAALFAVAEVISKETTEVPDEEKDEACCWRLASRVRMFGNALRDVEYPSPTARLRQAFLVSLDSCAAYYDARARGDQGEMSRQLTVTEQAWDEIHCAREQLSAQGHL